ncbi:hypothetical protein PR048_020716 [Dryococelus australis]|uniref:Uncharacterized protein n=1 Tax=Dryococelus australis TaxID=614101 RepID=A0ABQ9H747_9NEOP|nr:hypothetical protein PR048_020716 [Dryococelus australis]
MDVCPVTCDAHIGHFKVSKNTVQVPHASEQLLMSVPVFPAACRARDGTFPYPPPPTPFALLEGSFVSWSHHVSIAQSTKAYVYLLVGKAVCSNGARGKLSAAMGLGESCLQQWARGKLSAAMGLGEAVCSNGLGESCLQQWG